MNRGYTAYLKESKSAVKQTFKNKKNYIKFYAWVLLSFFCRLLILPGLIMDLSGVKLSKDVLERKEIKLFGTLEGACSGKRFWALFLVNLLIPFVYLGGLIIISFLGGLIFLLSIVIGQFVEIELLSIILYVIFAIPTVLAIIVFTILFAFKTMPINYVAYSDEEVSVSRILSKSFDAMKSGKFVLFLNYLRVCWFNFLYNFLFSLIIVAFEIIFTLIFGDVTILSSIDLFSFSGVVDLSKSATNVLSSILISCEAVLILFLFYTLIKLSAKITLTAMVSNYALFEDLVDDKYNQNKVALGVFVSKNRNKKVKDMKVKDVFATIDDVEYDVDKDVITHKNLQDLNDVILLDDELVPKNNDSSEEVNKWVYLHGE